MKSLLLASAVVVSLTGCVNAGTYTNKSTPDGIEIEATGMAAVEAARANPSFNCPTCQASADTKRYNYTPSYSRTKTGAEHRAELREIGRRAQYQRPSIGEWAQQEFKREVRYNTTRKIRKEISRFMDRVF